MTVALHLKEPYAPILTGLAGSIGALAGISPAAVKQYGKDFSRHGGGTGPFKFSLWESGQRFVLEGNKEYWGGAPKLDGVVFRPIIDAEQVGKVTVEQHRHRSSAAPDIATFTASRNSPITSRSGHARLPGAQTPEGEAVRRPARIRRAANWSTREKPSTLRRRRPALPTAVPAPTPPRTWAHDGLSAYRHGHQAKRLLAAAGYPFRRRRLSMSRKAAPACSRRS